MEEAVSVLDREEQQQLQQQQESALSNLEEKNSFVASYVQARREQRERGSKHSKAVQNSLKQYPTALPLALNQSNVKRLLPSGAVCWRGNVRGEWWGHLRPHTSFHRKLADSASEHECVKEVLQELWTQWCQKEGLDAKSACPIVGLF